MSRSSGWIARVRAVGEAFLGVLRAEVAELAADLGRSGRALVRALVLIMAAAGVAFWSLGLLLYFAVELLALVLPRWGAVGVVLGVFVLIATILLLLARHKLRAVESPTAAFRRRFDDHQRWWQESIVGEDAEIEGRAGEEDES